MKKFISISFTLLLTFIFTYAGSGINAYTFCCDDCQLQGVEAIVHDKCCDIHHNDPSSTHSANTDGLSEQSHDQCSLERVSINLQEISIQKDHNELTAPVFNYSFSTLLYNLTFNSELASITDYISKSQKPPNLSESVHFSMLQTLII